MRPINDVLKLSLQTRIKVDFQAEEFGKVRCEDSETYCVDFRVTTVYNKKAKLRYKEEYRFKGCSNITVSSLINC